MPRPAKKKGGRVTAPPPHQGAEMCRSRSGYYGKRLPHKFTSRRRSKAKDTTEYGPWQTFCSWCCRKEP